MMPWVADSEDDVDDSKVTVRQRVRAARAGRRPDAAAGPARVEHLLGLLQGLPDLPAAGLPRGGVRTVAAYVAVGTEPATTGLLAALLTVGARVLLPVLLADDDLGWGVHTGELVPGRRGTLHPPGPHVPLAEADLVVVPALAVDLLGARLGQGGGSYDRALPRRRPGVPALAWLDDDEVVDALPTQPWDVPVAGAVTPSGIRWFRAAAE